MGYFVVRATLCWETQKTWRAYCAQGQNILNAPKIAALFVQVNGAYWNNPEIDAWDKERDARRYTGPLPVVAHPPCQLWGAMANVNFARWGGEHNRPGNDGGCFAAALAAVNRWGGVLEHPAKTRAWAAHGPRTGLGNQPEQAGSVAASGGFAKCGNRPMGIERTRRLGSTTTATVSLSNCDGSARLERTRLDFMISEVRRRTNRPSGNGRRTQPRWSSATNC